MRSLLFCYAVFILSQVTQKCSSKRLNRNPDGLRNYFLTTTKNKKGMRGWIHNLSRRAGAVLTPACQEGLSFHLRGNLRHVQAVRLKQVAVLLKQVASEVKEHTSGWKPEGTLGITFPTARGNRLFLHSGQGEGWSGGTMLLLVCNLSYMQLYLPKLFECEPATPHPRHTGSCKLSKLPG